MKKKLRPSAGDARFDHGHGDPTTLKTFTIKSYDFKSASDMPVKNTAGYADNNMEDPSQVNEDDDTGVLNQLHAMLSKAGVRDDEIVKGVQLTQKGYQKVAAALGISADKVGTIINSLITKVRRDEKQKDESVAESMSDARYTYEPDVLGNVALRDTQTGNEEFLTGSEGISLIHALDGVDTASDYAQGIMSAYFGHNDAVDDGFDDDDQHAGHEHSLHEEDEEKPGFNFAAEIRNDVGSFNFPWTINHTTGTATAAYKKLENGKLDLKIVSARDDRGTEMNVDSMFAHQLELAAKDFIGKE